MPSTPCFLAPLLHGSFLRSTVGPRCCGHLLHPLLWSSIVLPLLWSLVAPCCFGHLLPPLLWSPVAVCCFGHLLNLLCLSHLLPPIAVVTCCPSLAVVTCCPMLLRSPIAPLALVTCCPLPAPPHCNLLASSIPTCLNPYSLLNPYLPQPLPCSTPAFLNSYLSETFTFLNP